MPKEEKSYKPNWREISLTLQEAIATHTSFILCIPNESLIQLQKIADKHNKTVQEEICFLIDNHIEKAKIRKIV